MDKGFLSLFLAYEGFLGGTQACYIVGPHLAGFSASYSNFRTKQGPGVGEGGCETLLGIQICMG